MQRVKTMALLGMNAIKTVIVGMAIRDNNNIFLTCFDKYPTKIREGIITAQKTERANFPESDFKTSVNNVSTKKANPFSNPT